MMPGYYSIEDFKDNLIPVPHETTVTRGTEEGIVLKFQSYYLKIYFDELSGQYEISLYEYSVPRVFRVYHVQQNKMVEFFKEFPYSNPFIVR